MEKKYRTQEQFEEIADSCLNGNLTRSGEMALEAGFTCHELVEMNMEHGLFSDKYDLAYLIESMESARRKTNS